MEQSGHPYKNLPDRAFWRKAVQNVHPLEIEGWYKKKFEIGESRIAAAGSCFAQHIGRQLKAKGFDYLDAEPPPPLLREKDWLDFGYGMYSARYANIYTPRQLLQLAQRATGAFVPQDRAWPKDGGYVDPFRPVIEPEPLASPDDVDASRMAHLTAVKRLFGQTEVFVFTLGLTEAWVSKVDGAVFPLAPGVSGGAFDPAHYAFRNFTFSEVLGDMSDFIAIMRAINPEMKFLLTVSPVPLMATASDQHVVVATTYSKSVLRAAAGELAAMHDFVDYFPSFEIISSHVMCGQFYEMDKRGVTKYGVNHVMKQFFREHLPPASARKQVPEPEAEEAPDDDDVQCEEELLAGDSETAIA